MCIYIYVYTHVFVIYRQPTMLVFYVLCQEFLIEMSARCRGACGCIIQLHCLELQGVNMRLDFSLAARRVHLSSLALAFTPASQHDVLACVNPESTSAQQASLQNLLGQDDCRCILSRQHDTQSKDPGTLSTTAQKAILLALPASCHGDVRGAGFDLGGRL